MVSGAQSSLPVRTCQGHPHTEAGWQQWPCSSGHCPPAPALSEVSLPVLQVGGPLHTVARALAQSPGVLGSLRPHALLSVLDGAEPEARAVGATTSPDRLTGKGSGRCLCKVGSGDPAVTRRKGPGSASVILLCLGPELPGHLVFSSRLALSLGWGLPVMGV